jgi:GNAT superfamily N-acetyltransferase
MTFVVRPARPEDGRAVAEVHRTTSAATYSRWIPYDLADYDLDQHAAAFERGAFAEDRRLTVAVEGAAVVGFATSGPARGDDVVGAGEIYALHVHPERHGRGIGRALMADALGWLATVGYPECILWVVEPSTRSRRFYERVGFVLDEGARDEWRGLATVRYRHPLG